jgi:hypothetical protein
MAADAEALTTVARPDGHALVDVVRATRARM